MNVATCTLIAQIIPLLLIASAWFNAKIAVLKGRGKQGFVFWTDLAGLVMALISLVLCILGVNHGGLEAGWQVACGFGGLYVLLVNVVLHALYMHTVKLPD